MKSFVTYLCSLALIIASLFLGASVFIRIEISDSLLLSLVDVVDMETTLYYLIAEFDLEASDEYYALADTVSYAVANDSDVEAQEELYIDAMFSDILNQTSSTVESTMNEVLEAKLLAYASDFAALDDDIDEEEMQEIISEVVYEYDIQASYDYSLANIATEYSPTQQLVIRLFVLMQEIPFILAMAAIVVLATLAIAFMHLRWFDCLIYLAFDYFLAFLFMAVLTVAIPIMLKMIFFIVNYYGYTFDMISLWGFTAAYFIIFLAMTIFKVTYNKRADAKLKKQQAN